MVAPSYAQYDAQKSIIEELDPRKDIHKITEQLLGIFVITEQDSGKVKVTQKRLNRPLFSEEFVSHVKFTLFSYMNNTNAFSKYDPDAIKIRMLNISAEIVELFATHGNDEYISQKTWLKILKIHDSTDGIEGNSKQQVKSGWEQFGIKWTYDSPVTSEMVSYVKEFDEEEDQAVIFMNATRSICRTVESVFRRSLEMPDSYGMFTSALAGMRNENYSQQAPTFQNTNIPMGGQNGQ